jgi:hypothetical protein
MIGVNPIATENNTIITLHLDDKERGSERLVPILSSMEMMPLASIWVPRLCLALVWSS